MAKSAPDSRFTIAAIVPLYNGAPYIAEALASVLTQRRPADEIIVVDDGSTDAGPEIVRTFARQHPQIRLVSKPNGGQGSARNFGVRHSRSDLIAFLDQDDMWYIDHLAELERPFLADVEPRLGYSYSNLDQTDRNGRMVLHAILDHVPGLQNPKTSLRACLARDLTILPGASLIARKAFDAVGGFDERLTGYEDDDLFLRLFRHGYVSVYLDKPLCAWRIHQGSASHSLRMWSSRHLYFRKLVETYPNDPVADVYWVRDFIAPRFAAAGYADLKTAMRREDPDAIALARAHLEDYVAELAPARRRRMKRRMWLFRLRVFALKALGRIRRPSAARSPIARDI